MKTHWTRLARLCQRYLGISYQDALQLIIELSNDNQLAHPMHLNEIPNTLRVQEHLRSKTTARAQKPPPRATAADKAARTHHPGPRDPRIAWLTAEPEPTPDARHRPA